MTASDGQRIVDGCRKRARRGRALVKVNEEGEEGEEGEDGEDGEDGERVRKV